MLFVGKIIFNAYYQGSYHWLQCLSCIVASRVLETPQLDWHLVQTRLLTPDIDIIVVSKSDKCWKLPYILCEELKTNKQTHLQNCAFTEENIN